MTLDLDELERKARATPDGAWMEDVGPSLILALIERVRELERDRHTVAHELGCADDAGAYAASNAVARIRSLETQYVMPSQWRCDGCSAVVRPDDGRRPESHDGCGGYWVRQERTENA